jgi:hypothetical protein
LVWPRCAIGFPDGSSSWARLELNAAKAMALTTYDLLTQPDFLAAVKAEWKQSRP